MSKSKCKKARYIPLKEFELNNSVIPTTATSGCNVSLDADSSNETNQSVNLCMTNKSSSFEKSEDLSNGATPSNFKSPRKSSGNTIAKKQPQNLRKTDRMEAHRRRNNVHKSDNYEEAPEQNLQKNNGPDSTSVEDQQKMIHNKRYHRKNKCIAEEAHNLRPRTSEMTQDVPSKFFAEPKLEMNTNAQIFVPKNYDTKSEAKSEEDPDDWTDDNNITHRKYNVTEKTPGRNKNNNDYFRNSPRLPAYTNKTKSNQENVWYQNYYKGLEKDRNKGDFRTENNIVKNSNQMRTTEDNNETSGEKYHRKDDYRMQDNNNYYERPCNSNYNSKTSRFRKQPYERKPYKQITPNDKWGARESYQKHKHFYDRNWSNSKNRDKNKNWQSNNEDTENWDDTETLTDTNSSNTNSQERSWNEYKEEPANRSRKDEYVKSCVNKFAEKPTTTYSKDECEESNKAKAKEKSWAEQFEEEIAIKSTHDDEKSLFNQHWESEISHKTRDININENDYSNTSRHNNNQNRSKPVVTDTISRWNVDKPRYSDTKIQRPESELYDKSFEKEDKEYTEFNKESLKQVHHVKTQEQQQDLFMMLKESEISHKTRGININAYDCSNTSRQKNNQNRRSEPVVTDRTFRWNVNKPRHSDTKIERPTSELYDKSFEKEDKEYAEFNKESLKQVNYEKTKEQQQDLFMMPKDYSLAHCVAQDFRMGSGIAVQFKTDFKEVANLLAQRQKQGGLAILENQTKEGKRYIYYLVTKIFSTGKPTYETFWSSLKKMRDHIRENKVTKLAIPKLGCGLDRLKWSRVKSMIEYLFKDIGDMDIVICNFQQSEDSFNNSPQKDYSSCKVVNVEYPLVNIEPETMILYFTTEKGEQTKEMETLNGKFSFRSHHNSALRHLGQVIKYEKTKNYILYGCVVRKAIEDPFDFESFGKCLAQINKDNKNNLYGYVGITPVEDVVLHEQILTLMKTMLKYVSIYVCRDNSSSNWSDDSIKIKPSTN